MKSSILDVADTGLSRTERQKQQRRKISAILRAAYQVYGRDAYSRRAVKHVLRG